MKPLKVCSAPTTTTFAALRPAAVAGTCAHDWANGAAAIVPFAASDREPVFAAADVTVARTTTITAGISQ